jgi:LuxR family transcriptional regulator, regulator of acetate metabolism
MTVRPGVNDPVEEQLQHRLEQAVADAHRLLRRPADRAPTDAEHMSELIEAIETQLTQISDDSVWRESAADHNRELERLHQRYQARFDALNSAEEGVAALRAITSPSAIVSRAPKELCEHSKLNRAVLSLINEGFLVAEAAYFRGDPVGAVKALEALRAQPPRLKHPLIETELLRRRRATIVTDAHIHPRVHRPTAEIIGWHSYLAAPLLIRGEVIGAIHADSGIESHPLDVLDGDVLWTFARGLADVYETSSLRRSLRRQRERTRQFVEWLTARSIELSETSMQLVSEPATAPSPPGKLDAVPAGSDIDDRLVFQELLTRRELDVLRLLRRGETNGGIAAHLVISEATVKFHVVNLLRKLHVSNRAEAVARYHQLVRLRREDT